MAEKTGKTILVVDDEPDVRTFFKLALEEAGFDVVVATNGEEALAEVKKKVPDLISLDLVMPKKSGVKFMYELQKNRDWKGIPVLVVTAHAQDELGKGDLEDIQNRSISGPGVYLEKPVTSRKYVKCIKQILNLEFTEEEEQALNMKEELNKKLNGADPEMIKKMLDMLGD